MTPSPGERYLLVEELFCCITRCCTSIDMNIKKIENQANTLIRKTCSKSFSKSEIEKLLVSGTKPAPLYIKIKDHKTKDIHYPSRPIASSIGNPTNKVDWLVTKILNQLIGFIQSNVKNSMNLIDNLKKIELNEDDNVFMSLDVTNLYPSIPIQDGIKVVSEFVEKYWTEINTFDIEMCNLINCLKFVCYNYYIE